MVNPFERFYDAEVEVYSLADRGYSNGDTKTYLGKMTCDLQPVSDETDSKTFGLDNTKRYRIYTDKHSFLKEGNLAYFAGGWYRITGVMEWSLGVRVDVRSVDNG